MKPLDYRERRAWQLAAIADRAAIARAEERRAAKRARNLRNSGE